MLVSTSAIGAHTASTVDVIEHASCTSFTWLLCVHLCITFGFVNLYSMSYTTILGTPDLNVIKRGRGVLTRYSWHPDSSMAASPCLGCLCRSVCGWC